MPGATYGSFAAACHYIDGTFTFARVQELCPKRSPEAGARFNFWHPDLVTLHVWVWYHNPDGLYSGTNPWSVPSTTARPPSGPWRSRHQDQLPASPRLEDPAVRDRRLAQGQLLADHRREGAAA